MRIRTIKPEFWQHEGLAKLPDFTRLLAIALLNWADDEGYFLASPALIRGNLFPFQEDSRNIPGALQELSNAQFIRLGIDSQQRQVGKVVNFEKHQQVNKPRASKIKGSTTFPDVSGTAPGLLPEASREEWNGMEGIGSGKGMEGKPPLVPPPGGDGKPQESPCSAPETRNVTGSTAPKPLVLVNEPTSGEPESEPPASTPDAGAKKKKGARRRLQVEDLVFPVGFPPERLEIMLAWARHKWERREHLTQEGWTLLCSRVLKHPAEVVEAGVKLSIERPWKGIAFVHFQPDGIEAPVVRHTSGAARKKEGGTRPTYTEMKREAQEDELLALPRLPLDDREPEWDWRGVAHALYDGCWESWADVPEENRREMLSRHQGGTA